MSHSGTISEAMVEALEWMLERDRRRYEDSESAQQFFRTANQKPLAALEAYRAALSVPTPGTGGAECKCLLSGGNIRCRDCPTPQAGDLGAVKVKLLEWAENPGTKILYAYSMCGRYKINPDGYWWLGDGAMISAGSVEAAKDAAQSDYASRILSALSSSPVGEMVLVPDGDPVTLDDCPEGLFLFGKTLAVMTEYATDRSDIRQRDAYIVESGEYFWGGTSYAADRAKLIVQPLAALSQDEPADLGDGNASKKDR